MTEVYKSDTIIRCQVCGARHPPTKISPKGPLKIAVCIGCTTRANKEEFKLILQTHGQSKREEDQNLGFTYLQPPDHYWSKIMDISTFPQVVDMQNLYPQCEDKSFFHSMQKMHIKCAGSSAPECARLVIQLIARRRLNNQVGFVTSDFDICLVQGATIKPRQLNCLNNILRWMS
jgi:hypothetical protein